MKRISILVLLILALVASLVACNEPAEEPVVDTHEHSYTDEWCADATNHWHVADCEHTDKVTSKYAHKNKDGNGTCDQCGYTVAWTVSVDADEKVTVTDTVYVDKTAGTATFTATASEVYRLDVEGATLSGTPSVENGVATYTYTVSASADADVTIDAVKINYVTACGSDSVDFDEEGNAKLVAEIALKKGNYDICNFCDDEFLLTNVTLADAEGNVIGKDWGIGAYTIAEDGVYTVTVSVSSSELTSVELGYSVVALSDVEVTLDAAEGEGYIFANGMSYEVSLPIAESGMYKFSTTSDDVSIDYEMGACYTYLEAGNATFNVYGAGATTSYEFNWKLEKVETFLPLENGENTVTLPVGETVVVEFVADAKGYYSFATANWSSLLTYSFEEGYMVGIWDDMEYKLEEGDSLIICVRTYAEEALDETITVSYREPDPSFTVEVTDEDTYTFNVRYEFTAEVSGTYTFFFPEGISVGMADVIDAGGDPFLNLYGYETPEYVDGLFAYDVDIAADDSVTFAFMAFETGEIEVLYVVDEHEVSGGGDVGGGDENPATLDANGLGGEYTFQFGPVTFELNFMPDAAGATTGVLNVVDGNAAANGGMFAYEIVDGAYVFSQGGEVVNSVIVTNNGYMWSFQNFSLRAPVEFAEYTAPAGGGDVADAEDLLINGSTQIEMADATYQYTAETAGTLTITMGAAIMGPVEVSYTVNGGASTVLELSESTDIVLAAGDVVVVTVVASGYSSITTAWVEA